MAGPTRLELATSYVPLVAEPFYYRLRPSTIVLNLRTSSGDLHAYPIETVSDGS